MKHWFKLVRWPNLLIMAAALYLVRYALVVPLNFAYTLNDLHYFLLVLSTMLVGAAGYVINDLHDLEADRINKPHRQTIGVYIREASAERAFWIFSALAVAIGLYLGWVVDNLKYGFINAIAISLLYLYARDFKARPLLGNVLVSFLSAGVITYPGFFDIVPATNGENAEFQAAALYIMVGYALFAFLVNLSREMVKDLEDLPGDLKSGYRTLPAVYGVGATRTAVSLQLLLLLAGTGYLLVQSFSGSGIASAYLFLLSLFPPVAAYLLWTAKKPSAYKKISTLFKIWMVAGLLSMAVFTFTLNA